MKNFLDRVKGQEERMMRLNADSIIFIASLGAENPTVLLDYSLDVVKACVHQNFALARALNYNV